MPLRGDVQQLVTQSLVELFVWDDTVIGGTTIFRWHPGTTITGESVFYQGYEYFPYPVEATGFEITSSGDLPRPRLRAANIGGEIGAYIRRMGGALGARVTRIRTFGKFLDAVNFEEGNPYANPTSYLPADIYYVARKISENAIQVEIELAAKFDVMGTQLPRRQVMAHNCPWVYRSAECTYAGPPKQDIYGNFTAMWSRDACNKTIDACKARFGAYGTLMHGGFPASLLVRQSQ